jgi:hypothetical protein
MGAKSKLDRHKAPGRRNGKEAYKGRRRRVFEHNNAVSIVNSKHFPSLFMHRYREPERRLEGGPSASGMGNCTPCRVHTAWGRAPGAHQQGIHQ